jgi:Tol biopolymer transport system component
VELTDPTLYRLQRLNLAGGMVQPLHPDAATSEFEPAWAADGQCYAYLKTRGALSIGITVRDSQGAILGEIQPEPGFFGFRAPAVAPNKSRIAFSYGEGGAQQIFASRLNGEDRRALTNSKGLNHWPAFSPDGRSMAFGSSRDGNFEIYIMQADGSDPRRLTDHPLQDIRPRFSPDGKRLAFTSHRDGNAEIYLIDVDGSNLRRVTDHAERDDYPDWHPDGKHLVTVSERQGRHDVYLWEIAD